MTYDPMLRYRHSSALLRSTKERFAEMADAVKYGSRKEADEAQRLWREARKRFEDEMIRASQEPV